MPSPSKEFLRRRCVALLRLGLRLSSRPYRPPAGTALVVAPHADDETLGCGGFIASQVRAGRLLTVVYLTDSAGAGADPSAARAWAEKRRAEAGAALAVLGLPADRIEHLGLPDGTLNRLPPEVGRAAVDRLARLIGQLRPAEVLVPYHRGGSTEHTAAWGLTVAALGAAGGGLLLEYPIWAWWNPLRLRNRLGARDGNRRLALGPWRAVKRRALACHASQVVPVPPAVDPALPASLAWACCGPTEFFFASHVPAAHDPGR